MLTFVLLVGCESAVPSPTASLTPVAASLTIPTETPRTSELPSPTIAVSPRPTSVAGVRASALGELSGNWVFAAKQVFDLGQPEVQIWVVPIAGGTPKLAASYDVYSGGAPEAPIDNAPYLRRMFSPDGRRLVASVKGELVVVDLASGSARALGTSGLFPSWSKDGSRIAFLLQVPRPDAIGPDLDVAVISADGGAVRKVAEAAFGRQSLEWSPDGSLLVVPQQGAIAVVDVARGRTIRTISVNPGPPPSFIHWRRGTPELALALFGCVDSKSLVLLGSADASATKLVESPDRGERCLVVHDPRWNPAANELLYVGAPMNELCCRAHVVHVPSGTDAVLPIEVSQATWSADGSEVVYITPMRGPEAGSYVRVWPRDGRPERELLDGRGYQTIVSIASLAY